MESRLVLKLPYNHQFTIVSPCSGSTVAAYARVVSVEGLNSFYADISSIPRVGVDGALYTGQKMTYKTLTVQVDASDEKITWIDFYSFFTKSAVYTLLWDNKYIHAAISKIDMQLFDNVLKIATIVFECDAAFWSTDVSISTDLTLSKTAATAFTYTDILGRQDINPDFEFIFGAQVDQSISGITIKSESSADARYIYSWEFSAILIPQEGATLRWFHTIPNYMYYLREGTYYRMKIISSPDAGARVRLGDTYAVTLQQSDLNIAQQLKIKTIAVTRDYN